MPAGAAVRRGLLALRALVFCVLFWPDDVLELEPVVPPYSLYSLFVEPGEVQATRRPRPRATAALWVLDIIGIVFRGGRCG